jgi:hypothetical protein
VSAEAEGARSYGARFMPRTTSCQAVGLRQSGGTQAEGAYLDGPGKQTRSAVVGSASGGPWRVNVTRRRPHRRGEDPDDRSHRRVHVRSRRRIAPEGARRRLTALDHRTTPACALDARSSPSVELVDAAGHSSASGQGWGAVLGGDRARGPEPAGAIGHDNTQTLQKGAGLGLTEWRPTAVGMRGLLLLSPRDPIVGDDNEVRDVVLDA